MKPHMPFVIALLIALATGTAIAQPGRTPHAMFDEATVSTSYRQVTMSVDAIALGLLVAGGAAEGQNGRDTALSDTLFTTGGLGALFAVPIVHGVRGHLSRSIGSFGLRAGLANVGALVALGMRDGCEEFLCQLDYVGYGVFGGLVVAALIDGAAFTTETTKVRRPTRLLVPQLSMRESGGVVGLAGTF